MIYLLLILNFALATLSNVDNALIPTFNQLKNGGFESSKANWTASGGTFATTTTSPMIGLAHATWDSGSASQTLTSTATTIPSGLYSVPVEAFCYIKVPSGTATHTMNVVDGSGNALGTSVTLISSTNSVKTSVSPFLAPSSGSWSIRFTSVASDEPSISIDGCYLGSATNIGSVQQAQFAGTAYFATTTNCGWSRTNTALGAFGTDTDCPGPTVESQKIGSWQTTDADLPQITINSLPPGLYRVIATFTGGPTGGDNASVYALSDGTTTTGRGNAGTVVNTASGVTIEAYFEYTTTGNRTFAVHGSSSSNNVVLYNDIGNRRLYFNIYQFPLQSQTAYTTDQSDYPWTSYTPTGAWSTNTTYTGFHRKVGDSLELDLKVAVTGAPTSASLTINLPTGLTIDTAKLTDTTAAISSRLCRGTIRDAGTDLFDAIGVYNSTTSIAILKDDGDGTLSAVTQAAPMTWASGDFLTLQCDGIPISGWQTTNRAPQLINSRVNSQYAGVTTTAQGSLNCDAGSAINSQLGGITSIGNISSGACAVNITAAGFTATPFCQATHESNGSVNQVIQITARSSTSVTIDCNDTAGLNCTTFDFNLYCEGAK